MSANVENVNFFIHARIGNKYEVFEHDGAYYINAPLDESQRLQRQLPYLRLYHGRG